MVVGNFVIVNFYLEYKKEKHRATEMFPTAHGEFGLMLKQRRSEGC